MGVYIDRHGVGEVDAAVRYQLQLEAQHGIRDVSGTLPLGHWVEDGTIYCLLEAPDAQCVRQHHSGRGLKCDELHPLTGIVGSKPFSGEERALILAAIQQLWHNPADG